MTVSATLPVFFTLIAYRPDGADYCRGCLMEQSSSEFSLSTADSADAIAQNWARLRFDAPQGREYGDTEYTLLLNGRPEDEDYALEHPDMMASGELRKEVHRLTEQHLAALHAAQAQAQARAAEQARVQQEADEAERQLAREAVERAEFARLQAKFGSTP